MGKPMQFPITGFHTPEKWSHLVQRIPINRDSFLHFNPVLCYPKVLSRVKEIRTTQKIVRKYYCIAERCLISFDHGGNTNERRNQSRRGLRNYLARRHPSPVRPL